MLLELKLELLKLQLAPLLLELELLLTNAIAIGIKVGNDFLTGAGITAAGHEDPGGLHTGSYSMSLSIYVNLEISYLSTSGRGIIN